jgi:hypothetical protein
MDTVYASLVDFMKDVKTNTFDTKKYNVFSRVIATSKAFGEGAIDTIDVVDFATRMNSSKSSGFIDSVKLAVAYNKTNQYVENANGMSIFIPNKKLSYYDKMLKIYQNIGMGGEYTNVLSQYANVLAGGKNKTYSVNNKTYTQDTTNYASYTWYDKEVASQSSNLYTLDASKLKVNDKGDYFALQLSKSDWSKVTKVESVIWYDTGKGYVDMGADSYYELDSTGDLKIESDGSWLAINGENVHYEVIERTKNYEKGRVPAVLNNERVNLILYFDKQNPDGEVLGYEPDYEGTSQTLYEKGLRTIKENDKIDFVAPYYTHDGKVQDEFYINDTLVVGSEPLEVSYEYLGDNEILIYYRLTDIYNNIYYTEPVILY